MDTVLVRLPKIECGMVSPVQTLLGNTLKAFTIIQGPEFRPELVRVQSDLAYAPLHGFDFGIMQKSLGHAFSCC